MISKTLYLKDSRGSMRFWEIKELVDGFIVQHGLVGGASQIEQEHVPHGLAGRTQAKQIQNMVNAKIKKRIEKGYSESIEAAQKKDGRGANELGFARPMLAVKYDADKQNTDGYFVQPKLDGHRCLISIDGSSVQAYSRNGKVIDSIHEILETLSLMGFKKITLDGELYIHGKPLQSIASYVKRRQPETEQLEYWIYDIVSDEPFYERFNVIEYIFESFNNIIADKYLKMTPTVKLDNEHSISSRLRNCKSMGFEGLILRDPESGYEAGKRSKSLIKVKSWEDDEFEVVDVSSSKEGWAILTCVMDSGKTFDVSAPGNMLQKTRVLENKESYIGKKLNVEYANLTKYGIPFHPVAKYWRDKENE